MATVKLKQGAALVVLVTAEGAVKCTCCPVEGECCMYDARLLSQGVFSTSDLPDSITVVDTFTEPGEELRFFVTHNLDGSYGEGGFNPGQGVPGAFPSVDGWNVNSGQVTPDKGPCLFREQEFQNISDNGIFAIDNFEDTYKIEFNNVSNPASSEENGSAAFVVRRSLCVWSEDFEEDKPIGVTLQYLSRGSNRPIWRIKYSISRTMGKAGPTGQLDGPLNTPEGAYGSSGGESAIVSEE